MAHEEHAQFAGCTPETFGMKEICASPWSLAETNEGELAEFTGFQIGKLSVNRGIHKHSHFVRDPLSKSELRPN